jgi:hypothetical protein
MTPERWREIEQLYQLALEHEAGQRAAFLVDACRGDEEMRREIESLLMHAEPAEGFMEASGMAVLAQAIAQERSGSMVGQQIGAHGFLRSSAPAAWVRFTVPETRDWDAWWH